MPIKLSNPFDVIIKAYTNLYGNIDIKIAFDPNMESEKISEIFVENGTAKLIHLNYRLPMSRLVEITGHELAHVRVGVFDDDTVKDPHGKEWDECYYALRNEFVKIVMEKATSRRRIKIIRASKDDWYDIGEEYIVRDDEIYKGIGIQVELLKPELARTYYIPDGDYEHITS